MTIEQAFQKDLHATLDQIFREWAGDLNLVADAAGLHPNTLYRLEHADTKSPLYRTVWKLARAAGLTIKFTHTRRLLKAG